MGTTVMLLLATAGVLEAQAPPFGRLEPGQSVRVKTIGGSRFVTRLGPAPGDSAGSLFGLADTPFEPGRVDSLWVRGRTIGTGAIVGAAVVTPLAFGFLVWLCHGLTEGPGCEAWGTVVDVTLVAGASGALLGAGVGALIHKWQLRYARDRDALVSPLLAPGRVGVALRF